MRKLIKLVRNDHGDQRDVHPRWQDRQHLQQRQQQLELIEANTRTRAARSASVVLVTVVTLPDRKSTRGVLAGC